MERSGLVTANLVGLLRRKSDYQGGLTALATASGGKRTLRYRTQKIVKISKSDPGLLASTLALGRLGCPPIPGAVWTGSLQGEAVKFPRITDLRDP